MRTISDIETINVSAGSSHTYQPLFSLSASLTCDIAGIYTFYSGGYVGYAVGAALGGGRLLPYAATLLGLMTAIDIWLDIAPTCYGYAYNLGKSSRN